MPGISSLIVGDFVLFILLFFLSAKIPFICNFRISRFCLILFLFVVCHLVFYIAPFHGLDSEVFFNTGHYLFALFIFTVFTKKFFNYEFALIIYKKVALISSVFLIAQLILANFAGFYLSGTIPFLEANHSIEIDVDKGFIINRFRGFFSEPSAIALYLCICISLCLYRKKIKISDYIPEIIMTIAVLLSMSTSGVGLLGIIWGTWLIKYYKKLPSKLRKKWLTTFVFVLPLLILVLSKAEVFQFVYEHVIDDSGGTVQMGRGLYGRIGSAGSVFDLGQSFEQILFGQGMIDFSDFIPGYSICFLYFGFFGLLFFISAYLYLFFKLKREKKIVILCIMAANFFADVTFGIASMWYFPYIFASEIKYQKI
jgi:hypothetical protein